MKPLLNNPLEAAISRMGDALHRKRARDFKAARLPYADEDTWTPLGDAAAQVVGKLNEKDQDDESQPDARP